jgi:hypothetical protein
VTGASKCAINQPQHPTNENGSMLKIFYGTSEIDPAGKEKMPLNGAVSCIQTKTIGQ